MWIHFSTNSFVFLRVRDDYCDNTVMTAWKADNSTTLVMWILHLRIIRHIIRTGFNKPYIRFSRLYKRLYFEVNPNVCAAEIIIIRNFNSHDLVFCWFKLNQEVCDVPSVMWWMFKVHSLSDNFIVCVHFVIQILLKDLGDSFVTCLIIWVPMVRPHL